MSTLKVDTLKNGSSGSIDFPQNLKIGGNGVMQGYTSSATEPSSPAAGDYWWDSSNEELYRYVNGEFKKLTVKAPGVFGDRGFAIGAASPTNVIQYWSMTSSGNAADFGDLNFNTQSAPACSDGTYTYALDYVNVNIDYFASATLGNATDFGDQRFGNTKEGAMESDGTIAVQMHGKSNNAVTANIDKFTVGTAGVTAVAFGGTSTVSDRVLCASYANTERMCTVGGCTANYGSLYNTCEYITFATESNATDAGDLTVARYSPAGAGTGEGSIGLAAGGYASTASNVIDRKDITTTSNATDHGDLSVTSYYLGGCANATKAHFFGGYNTNRIEQTDLATAGNGTDFGDLLAVKYYVHGTSGAAS